MRMKLVALIVAAVLVLGGASALAYAAQSNSTVPAPAKQQVSTPATDTGQQVKDTGEATGKESGVEKESTTEKEGHESATEKKAEEKGDKNLPGGGHQDPDGTNVNHQFEGVE